MNPGWRSRDVPPHAPPHGATTCPINVEGGDVVVSKVHYFSVLSLQTGQPCPLFMPPGEHPQEDDHTPPCIAPPESRTMVARYQIPIVPFIGGARAFPTASSRTDKGRGDGEGGGGG
jgi:hypothetical protein